MCEATENLAQERPAMMRSAALLVIAVLASGCARSLARPARPGRTAHQPVSGVRVKQGRPVSYEDFVTGFLTDGNVSGRPVDVKVGPDGSLYFSDDKGGRIYRVTWAGR